MYRRHLLLNLILVSSFFMVIFGLNFIVDPYNYNNIFDFNLDKKSISYKKHYRLYKMIEFKNNPKSSIILGDSRGGLLKESNFIEKDIYNFSYGGGSLSEVIDTFWFADKHRKIKKVILTIPFSMYNEYEYMNLTKEAQDFINKPYKYYFSIFITKISIINLYAKVFNKEINFEAPNINKQQFWKQQLNTANRFYTQYKYPEYLFNELKKISLYSNKNNIELKILIPPAYIKLQDKINEFNLNNEYVNYKNDLCSLGKVYDFDYKTDITLNRDNFNDPFHWKDEVTKSIINDLIYNKYVFSKKCLDKNNKS